MLRTPAVPLPEGSGGDRFDLADVGLAWAKYVRIEAATFATGPIGTDNAGFDLEPRFDGVSAFHGDPQILGILASLFLIGGIACHPGWTRQLRR